MTEPVNAMLNELSTEAAVLHVYRQAFAVLARETGAAEPELGGDADGQLTDFG